MKNSYDIAVIGESMAGKSTWISSLFRDDIGKKLGSEILKNTIGQTKITIRYILHNKEYFGIGDIRCNCEHMAQCIKEKKSEKAVKIIKEVLKIPSECCSGKEEEIAEKLKKYFESDNYQHLLKSLCPFDLISKLANELSIGESGMISHIAISGPANDATIKILQDYHLEEITIRDTRGFLDESEEKMQEYLNHVKREREKKESDKTVINPPTEEEKKKQYLQQLLDDRDVNRIDACIIMAKGGSNALNKRNNKSIYGPLIKNMLEKYPTFLVIRADKITEVYDENPDISYKEAIAKDEKGQFILLGRRFSGFKELRALLKDYGLFEKSDNLQTDIARKHYKELVLAEVDLSESDQQEIGEINLTEIITLYRKTALGALTEILSGIQEYFKNIEIANSCLKALSKKQPEILKQLFDEHFDRNIYKYSDNWGFTNGLFEYVTKYLSDKVAAEPYYGNIVGIFGGLTTWIPGEGRVGQAAIDFLQTAYKVQENLFPKLVNGLEPEIRLYAEQRYTKEKDIQEAVILLKRNILLKYRRDMDTNFERLSCTSRMIPRYYLEIACEQVKQELEVRPGYIGKYLKELETKFADERWLQDRYQMSVVKRVLWYLVCSGKNYQ